MIHSKELVDSYYKLGIGISYNNVLLPRDLWTMHDLERCSICSDEITEGQPSISVIDNDTLTGAGTSHRCNWMFLQRLERLGQEEHEGNIRHEQARIKDAKTVSQALTEKTAEMQVVTPYRTIKRGQPFIRTEPTTFSSSTRHKRKRSIGLLDTGLESGAGSFETYCRIWMLCSPACRTRRLNEIGVNKGMRL